MNADEMNAGGMQVNEEELMAWIDGELDAARADEVAQAVVADPALAARAERLRALTGTLRRAYAPVLEEPLPPRLQATLEPPGDTATTGESNVVSLRPRKAAPRVRNWRWPEWTALAASLVLGVLVSPWLLRHDGDRLLRSQDGGLVAGKALARVLDTQLASEAHGRDALAVGLSFRDNDGRYCRSFSARAAKTVAGLACRESGDWRVVAMADAADAAGELRQASTPLPASILAEIDARQAEMLDADAERAARARNWR